MGTALPRSPRHSLGPPGTGCLQGSVNLLPAGQDGLLDEGEDEEDARALAPLSLGEVVGDDVICAEKGRGIKISDCWDRSSDFRAAHKQDSSWFAHIWAVPGLRAAQIPQF